MLPSFHAAPCTHAYNCTCANAGTGAGAPASLARTHALPLVAAPLTGRAAPAPSTPMSSIAASSSPASSCGRHIVKEMKKGGGCTHTLQGPEAAATQRAGSAGKARPSPVPQRYALHARAHSPNLSSAASKPVLFGMANLGTRRAAARTTSMQCHPPPPLQPPARRPRLRGRGHPPCLEKHSNGSINQPINQSANQPINQSSYNAVVRRTAVAGAR